MSIINKTYPINIQAGESLLIQAGGTYVYCIDANQDSFRIAIDDVAAGVCAPGLGYERDIDEEPFSAVRIVNDNASALTATIVIGTGRVLDNRLTLTGTVAVETVKGFPASVQFKQIWVAASGANYTVAQIFNPAGSGKILAIDEFIIDSTAPTVYMSKHDAPLASAYPNSPQQVDRRSPAAVAVIYQEQPAAAIAGGGADLYFTLASAQLFYKPPHAYVLSPGEGFIFHTSAINSVLNVQLTWREVAL